MITFEEFRELSKCSVIGSRMIAEVGGKRNVDVGTIRGTAFELNEAGVKIVTDSRKTKDDEITAVAIEMQIPDLPPDPVYIAAIPAGDENKTFAQRAKGKK